MGDVLHRPPAADDEVGTGRVGTVHEVLALGLLRARPVGTNLLHLLAVLLYIRLHLVGGVHAASPFLCPFSRSSSTSSSISFCAFARSLAASSAPVRSARSAWSS